MEITEKMEFTGTVRDLSYQGLGVVNHPDGRVFFVPGVWPEDEGVFEITSLEKRYGYAHLKELLKPSSHRVQSPCQHQGVLENSCGGCPWMIADYASQLDYKQKRIQRSLEKSGILNESTQVHPIWGADSTLGYRNRAQLKTDGKSLGFVSSGSHRIAPVEDCLVLSEQNRDTLKGLIAQLPRAEWKPTGQFHWNFIEIDEEGGRESVSLNHRRPFKQGNDSQNFKMKSWLQNQIEFLDKNAPVVELFSGSGNFTEVFTASGFKKVWAIENAKISLQQLRAKALSGVEIRSLDLTQGKSIQELSKTASDAEVLLLDPPREGFKALDFLCRELESLQSIFYISCDLESFCRDVKNLVKDGWKLKEVQALDAFPHTPHIEILSRLERDDESR